MHVVDKATKLQTIYDRIGLIDTRFEVLKRDAEIRMLKAKLERWSAATRRPGPSSKRGCRAQIMQLDADREFLRFCNIGGERMAPEDQQRVRDIGTGYRWRDIEGNEDATS